MIVGKKNGPPESLKNLGKIKVSGVGKKMADMVIAKPQKTLEKQANPAKRHSRAGVTESRHGNGAAPNQWKTLGKQRYLQAPRALPANGRGQKK